VDSPKRAALVLADWETAQARYERDQVLEDGYGLLGAISAGQAIAGEILNVDITNKEAGPSGKTQVKRPLLTLSLAGECPFPLGTELWWTDRLSLEVEVVSIDPDGKGGTTVVLKVRSGMNGELPVRGARACFSSYNSSWIPGAPLPKQAPWTHTPPSGSSVGRGDIDDGPDLAGVLGLDGGGRGDR